MYLDDSSGIVGSDLHVLMAVHARACAATPPDPKRLAAWLAKLRLDGPGWPDFELRDYAAALGQKGRAELARIVDERAKAAQPEFGRTPFGIRILREQPPKSPETSTTTSLCWPKISTAPPSTLRLLTHSATPGAPPTPSTGRSAGWASTTRSTRPSSATLTWSCCSNAALQRKHSPCGGGFSTGTRPHPTTATYAESRNAPGTGAVCETKCSSTYTTPPRNSPRSPTTSSVCCSTKANWTRRGEWRSTTDDLPESRWHQLIDLRQPTHPQDAIGPWQRLIQQRLDASGDKYRYSKAITMLRKLRDAYRSIDHAADFDTYLGQLCEHHKRKTSFIAKLYRAGM
ncbi:hypothetical protein [Saccharopolyspora shandongensis]|uniref:hypothetical protein n=1 Tax=Saccharopolyspora shandongensis TaxID=418495 RepID=UPI003F4D4038